MSHLIDPNVDTNDPAFLYLNLHPDEKILFVVRHHWAGFLGTIGIFIALAIFPLLLVFVANLVFGSHLSQYLDILVAAISGFYLFLFTFMFGSWIDYYFDIVFITSERLLNVNQKGLLAREVSELSLQQVQDVTTQMDGFLHTFFNYGTLVVETAGEGTADSVSRPGLQGYFSVADLPDPNRLARVILEIHRKLAHEAL